jgi:hypothetical protein
MVQLGHSNDFGCLQICGPLSIGILPYFFALQLVKDVLSNL